MITIEPLSLRNATWIADNMTPEDQAEIMCQLPPDAKRSDAGAACYFATGQGWGWNALIDDEPVAAFGLSQQTYTTWVGWMFGTKHMKRAVPDICKHFRAQGPRLIEAGCRRIEVRTMKGHKQAHLLIRSLGAIHVTHLPDAGRNGERFELWAWTLTEHLENGSADNR